MLLLLLTAAVSTAPVEVAIQVGHTRNQMIRQIAFLPSGQHVITAGSGVSLWEVHSGRQLRAYRGQTEDIGSIAVSPDGRTLVTGSFDNHVRLFDIETGKLLSARRFDNGVQSVAFTPDGRGVAVVTYGSGRGGRTFSIVPVDGGAVRDVECLYGVARVAFSADGRRLVCASEYDAQIFNVATGQPIGDKFNHRSGAFHPKQPGVYVYVQRQDVHLRNLNTGTDQIVAVSTTSISDPPAVNYSPDGQRLVIGHDVLDAASYQVLMTAGDGRLGVLSPDGQTLAASKINEAALYDVASHRMTRAFDSTVLPSNGLATSSDGRYLVTAGATIRVWDLARGRVLRSLGAGNILQAFFFDHDKQLVFLNKDDERNDYKIQVADLEGGRIQTLPGWGDHIAIDGGTTLAASQYNQVRLLSLSDGKLVRQWNCKSGIASLAISADGKTIAAGFGDGKVSVWDEQGRPLGELDDKSGLELHAVAFSHAGKLLATGHNNGEIRLWSLPSLQPVRTLKVETPSSFNWVTAMVFSVDDTQLAAAHEDSQSELWDVASGKTAKRFLGHDYAITDIVFQSPHRVITTSEDRTVRLWNTDSGELVATFLAMQRDGYAIFTPDNYYTTSRGVSDSISFLRGLDVYPFDSFDLVFNRPDIIVDRLKVAPQAVVDAYKAAYAKRVRQTGFSESTLSADMHLPQARFTGAKPALEVKTRQLSLGVSASDSQYRLDRINLFVNGVPVFGQGGFSLKADPTSRFEKTFEIELSQGTNFIEVSAHNEKGLESAREQLEVRYQGPSTPATTWVVTFGVSKYADHDYDLKYAAKDAADVAETLRRVRSSTTAKVFSDARVTRESLAEARRFLEQSGVDDTVVVFVAGHGLLADDFTYYFASADTDFEKPEKRAIPYESLDGLLDGLKARKKLLLIDTCNSGEVDKEALAPIKTTEGSVVPHGSRGLKVKYKLSLAETQALLAELFADLRRGTGAVVISSAGGAEYALESAKWKNGVFTYALIEALQLKSADANKDRRLQVSELREHVSKRVVELTRGAQKPTVRRDNLFVDFPLTGTSKER